MAWPCDCCGHRTLPEPAGQTWAICPVCGWEDADGVGYWHQQGAWNPSELTEARRAFEACGASHPDLVSLVRPPRPDEARPAWWLDPERRRARLIADFTEAFAGVTLDGGISLREADAIDDYEMGARDERSRPPPGFGRSPPWDELGLAELSECPWGPFVFMDARGLRLYTPAFAVWGLRHDQTPNAPEFLLGALAFKVEPCRGLFTAPQRLVTAEWMWWLIQPPGAWLAEPALRALRAGWELDLDEERRAMLAAR